MINSVAYTPKASQVSDASTFKPSKSPLIQILAAKIIVILLLYLLGGLCSQQLASTLVTIGSSLQFWMTKNVGRKYLQAAWSIDTSQGQEVWIYEANFKSPASFQELFWYSQIIYGIFLIFAAVIASAMQNYSILCAIIIAFAANYVNFFAFSRIITMRNTNIFERIAQQANAQGQIRETIRLPLVYRSNSQGNLYLPLRQINQSLHT